jgi:hypothetical protein
MQYRPPSRLARRARTHEKRLAIGEQLTAWVWATTVTKKLPTGRTIVLTTPNRAQRRAEMARLRKLAR